MSTITWIEGFGVVIVNWVRDLYLLRLDRRVVWPAGAGPEVVETDVGPYAIYPRPELVSAVEASEGLVDAQKGLLRRFLGVLSIAEHAATEFEHAWKIALIDRLIGALVACLVGKNQGFFV
jgi:hypothetical protein